MVTINGEQLKALNELHRVHNDGHIKGRVMVEQGVTADAGHRIEEWLTVTVGRHSFHVTNHGTVR